MKEIRIDGVIGDIFNTAEDFAYRLDELNLTPGEDLLVRINSPGGSVFDGFSIFNQLKSLENKVNTRIEGLAASIASLIALAGETVTMTEVGSFMIHRATTMAAGDQEDLESVADGLAQIDETLVNVYASKTGLEKAEIEDMMDRETWMNPAKAKEKGFIDELEETLKAVAFLNSNNVLNMKKLELLFQKMGIVKNEGEANQGPPTNEGEAAPEAAQNEPPVTNQDEEEEEEEMEAQAAEETQAQGTEEAADETPDRLAEALEAILARLDAQEQQMTDLSETVSALNNGLGEFVDNRVKSIAKGIKSGGNVPIGQGNFGKSDKAWVDPAGKFRAQMKEIDQKTRITHK